MLRKDVDAAVPNKTVLVRPLMKASLHCVFVAVVVRMKFDI